MFYWDPPSSGQESSVPMRSLSRRHPVNFGLVGLGCPVDDAGDQGTSTALGYYGPPSPLWNCACSRTSPNVGPLQPQPVPWKASLPRCSYALECALLRA